MQSLIDSSVTFLPAFATRAGFMYLPARANGFIFSRAFVYFHILPRLPPLSCTANFPRLRAVSCFPALTTTYIFCCVCATRFIYSHGRYLFLVIPRLHCHHFTSMFSRPYIRTFLIFSTLFTSFMYTHGCDQCYSFLGLSTDLMFSRNCDQLLVSLPRFPQFFGPCEPFIFFFTLFKACIFFQLTLFSNKSRIAANLSQTW